MNVVTYTISGQLQTPATMNDADLATMREMAEQNAALEIEIIGVRPLMSLRRK